MAKEKVHGGLKNRIQLSYLKYGSIAHQDNDINV